MQKYRQLVERREQEVRAAHKHLGGLILALSDEPQSTVAWGRGANGEALLGAALDRQRSETLAVLHDRHIPGTRANIDHIVIGPAAVFVVDAKRYRGRVERRDRGSFFRQDHRLFVGGRDRSSLVKKMARQVAAVRTALADCPESPLVVPALCFVDSEWGLFASPLRFGDVRVLWPKALYKLVGSQGPLESASISRLERCLAIALPSA